jgi:hypothetical protein
MAKKADTLFDLMLIASLLDELMDNEEIWIRESTAEDK